MDLREKKKWSKFTKSFCSGQRSCQDTLLEDVLTEETKLGRISLFSKEESTGIYFINALGVNQSKLPSSGLPSHWTSARLGGLSDKWAL